MRKYLEKRMENASKNREDFEKTHNISRYVNEEQLSMDYFLDNPEVPENRTGYAEGLKRFTQFFMDYWNYEGIIDETMVEYYKGINENLLREYCKYIYEEVVSIELYFDYDRGL